MRQEKNPAFKDLTTVIWENSKKLEVIKEADKLLTDWQGLSVEEKISRRRSLLFSLAILDPKDIKLCVSQLAHGGVICEKDAHKEIDDTRLALGIKDASDEKIKDRPIYTASFDDLVDIALDDKDNPVFLVKEADNISVLASIKKDGCIYIPPPKEQIPWLLPSSERVLAYWKVDSTIGNSKANSILYDDLLNYHKAISELPQEGYYDLTVSWDLHTYLADSSKYSPIICLFAVPERGKTRTGQGMIYLAYRGIHVESLRDAYLVRVANDLNAALFFDVKDIWKKAQANGTEDILLHRYERGAKVPRVIYPERGPHKDMVYYSIFGPTIISTNEATHRILETRAIQINMPQSIKTFESDVTQKLALALKERLVSFRARHMNEILPDIPKPVPGRLGDILKPLQQMILLAKPEKEASFLKLAKELQEERLLDRSDTLEAQVLTNMLKLKDGVLSGILPVKDITDTLNQGKTKEYQFTYQRIGRRLQALGFKKARTEGGASAVIWDERLLKSLVDTYGLKETSVTPVTSVTPATLLF